jgi:hypothetical protein
MYYRGIPYYDPDEVSALLNQPRRRTMMPGRRWWRIVARAVLAQGPMRAGHWS